MTFMFSSSIFIGIEFCDLVAKVLVLIFNIFTSVLADIYRRGGALWVYVKLRIETLPVSTGTCC